MKLIISQWRLPQLGTGIEFPPILTEQVWTLVWFSHFANADMDQFVRINSAEVSLTDGK